MLWNGVGHGHNLIARVAVRRRVFYSNLQEIVLTFLYIEFLVIQILLEPLLRCLSWSLCVCTDPNAKDSWLMLL
uniref:Uncharacterized protein n=1 Tax=Physcomitrium patens TaxID=3218 RepID=A0A2K1IJJ6_PHYPA|nr:hypothetical protein PHYPA_028143 [Physcomitrium patens]